MADTDKRLKLTREAATELIDYIERIAKDSWIDVDPKHLPVRRSLHIFAGDESGWGARIPFSLYKKVVEKVHKDNAKLKPKAHSSVDNSNAQFEAEVDRLVDEGSTVEDAIDLVSGISSNLVMMADGVVESVIKMVESILPQAPIPNPLLETVNLVRDFAEYGVKNTPPAVSDFLDKLAPGWKYVRDKEGKTAHTQVLNYAYSYAIKNSGTDPARLWEMWAMYPTLKGVQASAGYHLDVAAASASGGGVVQSSTYLDNSLDMWDTALRNTAVLLSNTFALSALCCIIGLIASLDTVRAFLQALKLMLQLSFTLNINIMETLSLDVGKFAVSVQNTFNAALLDAINANYNKQVSTLRKMWLDLAAKSGIAECIPLEQLFDGMVGILTDLKNKMVIKLKGLLTWADANWAWEHDIQYSLMEQHGYNVYGNLLETVEKILDLELKCPVDGEANDRRALDIIRKLRFDGEAFPVHVRGTPLPEGMDPDYPLANLDPVVTGHNLTVEPGIQGSDLPNEELEELFSLCRRGNFNDASILETLPGIFRRR